MTSGPRKQDPYVTRRIDPPFGWYLKSCQRLVLKYRVPGKRTGAWTHRLNWALRAVLSE
jgi:hypothetical protein